jgi:hypothetical protein
LFRTHCATAWSATDNYLSSASASRTVYAIAASIKSAARAENTRRVISDVTLFRNDKSAPATFTNIDNLLSFRHAMPSL